MEEQYHEPVKEMSPAARDRAKAFKSLIEEIEAVDWYDQRCAVETDPELREILIHNRNEEIEHATMLLEWIRRKMPEAFDPQLKKYLFTAKNIVELEDEGDEESTGGLKIGKLK
ncbi:MAG: encapsulin-associated ferritin-like protein [Tannerellaceae bacterium]|nr:hypothetical protein [Porphyromonadaceae bacterium]